MRCLEVPCVSLNVSQIIELAEYIAQSLPEPERASYVESFQEKLVVEEGQTPLSEDIKRRRGVFSAVFGDVKGLGQGTERGAAQKCHHSDALSSHPSCNRDRGFLQPALRTSIEVMANRLPGNQKSRVQPPSHHHILDRSVCGQVSHVRLPSHPFYTCVPLPLC
jgi:hypothetical protein